MKARPTDKKATRMNPWRNSAINGRGYRGHAGLPEA
jgi:hypothetical protein